VTAAARYNRKENVHTSSAYQEFDYVSAGNSAMQQRENVASEETMIIHSRSPSISVDMRDDVRQFLDVADRLRMPHDERRGLLGISEEAMHALSSGNLSTKAIESVKHRRLAYALSLMRRQADVWAPPS
jgi:hypothetical protein